MSRLAGRRYPRIWRAGIACGLAVAMAAEAPSAARADTLRWFAGSVAMELQNDADYRSDDSGNERNNLTLKIEPEFSVSPPAVPGLSFRVHFTLDQLADAAPGENRVLEDEGLVLEELFAAYTTGRFFVRAGKTNPGFGIAWDRAPVVYGTDLVEDYELAERIVLSASIAFGGGGWGEHSLTGGTFFLDTTVLQPALLGRSRGTLGTADGGAGNTGDFSSFNLVLEGTKLPVDGLSYHLAFARQAHGTDGTADETGIAAALVYETALGGDVTLSALFELVRFDDFGGIDGAGRTYLTPAFQLGWRRWTLALAYTSREIETPGVPDTDDWQLQTSAGYVFASGLGAYLGWKRLRESGIGTDTIGLLLTWQVAL